LKKIIFIIYLVAFGRLSVYSQTISPREFDYYHADSIALNIPKNNYDGISRLADTLTRNLKTDHEKFRVIFRWITDNIDYSYANSTFDAEKVLKKKKAVCEGYASLLKALCDKVGIECQVIHGFAKNDVKDIGIEMTKTNHAWNIVKLYNNWYLVDATWASGVYKTKFRKRFDESYFLADPKFLILSHFPEDSKYQFLDTLYKIKDFIKLPIVYSSVINPLEKIKGEIHKNLFIRFTSKKVISKISLQFITDKYERPIKFINNDGLYEIKYAFNDSDKGKFNLYVDDECALGFIKK